MKKKIEETQDWGEDVTVWLRSLVSTAPRKKVVQLSWPINLTRLPVSSVQVLHILMHNKCRFWCLTDSQNFPEEGTLEDLLIPVFFNKNGQIRGDLGIYKLLPLLGRYQGINGEEIGTPPAHTARSGEELPCTPHIFGTTHDITPWMKILFINAWTVNTTLFHLYTQKCGVFIHADVLRKITTIQIKGKWSFILTRS